MKNMLIIMVQIVGEPSTQLMKDMGDEEKARIAKQIEKLGESGLKEKAVVLEKATEENEVLSCFFICRFPTHSDLLQGRSELTSEEF